MNNQAEFNRLYWHSRRGMLEIDVLLMPFTKYHYKSLCSLDQQAYRRLLRCEDQEIWEWLRGFQVPHDKDLARIIQHIRRTSGDLNLTQSNDTSY